MLFIVRAVMTAAVLALAAGSAPVASAGSAAAPALAPDALRIAAGKDFAERNCSSCHAVGRFGESPNPLSPPFRELYRRYPLENLQEALVEGIYVGHPKMPQFVLSDSDARSLVAYLKSLQPRSGREPQ